MLTSLRREARQGDRLQGSWALGGELGQAHKGLDYLCSPSVHSDPYARGLLKRNLNSEKLVLFSLPAEGELALRSEIVTGLYAEQKQRTSIANSLSLRNDKRSLTEGESECPEVTQRPCRSEVPPPLKLELSFFCYKLGVFKLEFIGRLAEPSNVYMQNL